MVGLGEESMSGVPVKKEGSYEADKKSVDLLHILTLMSMAFPWQDAFRVTWLTFCLITSDKVWIYLENAGKWMFGHFIRTNIEQMSLDLL